MIGLILEGGGMRAGFVAGALMALADHGVTGFDTALAVSASVPSLAYFVTDQRAEMEQVWRKELNTPRLVRYRNIPVASLTMSRSRPILDIDYLVYEVFRKKHPLRAEDLLASRIKCHFAVARAPDGRQAFLRPGDGDVYELFKAALAVPGAYPVTVRLGECEYVDGGTVNPLPARWLFGRGVDRVLAVLSKPLACEQEPPNFMERTILWRYLKRYDWMMEKLWEAGEAYNQEVAYLEKMSAGTPQRALLIHPENALPAGFITRDRRKIHRTIDLGYRETQARIGEIRTFLNGEPR